MPYNPTLDWLRLFAFLGVAWIHSPAPGRLDEWTLVGRWAVPFFVCTAVFLSADLALRRPEGGILRYAKKRVLQLYLAFAAWNAIYFGYLLVGSLLLGSAVPIPEVGPRLLLVGTAPHLWFLPFVAAAILFGFAAARFSVWSGFARAWGVVYLAVAVATALAPSPFGPEWLWFFSVSWGAAPALLGGLSLRLLAPLGGDLWKGNRAAALAAYAVCFLSMAALLLSGDRLAPLENLAGVALLVAALCWPGLLPAAGARPLGHAAFGLYAVHFLPVGVAQVLANRTGLEPELLRALVVFLVAVAGSIALCWCGNWLWGVRWLFSARSRHAPAIAHAPLVGADAAT